MCIQCNRKTEPVPHHALIHNSNTPRILHDRIRTDRSSSRKGEFSPLHTRDNMLIFFHVDDFLGPVVGAIAQTP